MSWIFKQLREKGLKPNGATYGLAMEVSIAMRVYSQIVIVL